MSRSASRASSTPSSIWSPSLRSRTSCRGASLPTLPLCGHGPLFFLRRSSVPDGTLDGPAAERLTGDKRRRVAHLVEWCGRRANKAEVRAKQQARASSRMCR